MGKWSDYPNCNDANLDIFANALQRYFMLDDDKDSDMDKKEHEYYPGIICALGLRNGLPESKESDLTDESMDHFFRIIKIYKDKYDDETAIGIALTFSHFLHNDDFGVFVPRMPKATSPFRNDINEFIISLIPHYEEAEELVGEHKMWHEIKEYFANGKQLST